MEDNLFQEQLDKLRDAMVLSNEQKQEQRDEEHRRSTLQRLRDLEISIDNWQVAGSVFHVSRLAFVFAF